MIAATMHQMVAATKSRRHWQHQPSHGLAAEQAGGGGDWSGAAPPWGHEERGELVPPTHPIACQPRRAHARDIPCADGTVPRDAICIVLPLKVGWCPQVSRVAIFAKGLIAGRVEAGKEGRSLRRVLTVMAVLVLRGLGRLHELPRLGCSGSARARACASAAVAAVVMRISLLLWCSTRTLILTRRRSTQRG
jgi:hypothetical protein